MRKMIQALALAAVLCCTSAALHAQAPGSPGNTSPQKTGYVPREDLDETAAHKAAQHERIAHAEAGVITVYVVGVLGPAAMICLTILLCTLIRLCFAHGRKHCSAGQVAAAVLGIASIWAAPAVAGPTGYVPRDDLMEVVAMRDRQASWRPPMTGSYPDKFRCQKYLGPVRNQGNCGSCWNFSGTTAVEGAMAKAGVLPAGEYLSPQFSMDCWRNGGCRGDDPSRVAEVAMKRGLPTEIDYGEYRARAGRCRGEKPLYKISDWGFCDGGGVASADSIKAAMLEHGPISVCIAADGAFSNYRKGTVFRGSARGVNHAVVLVGWDDSLGEKGAWLLRNSWGEDWGDQGHCWIEYGSNRVGTAAFWCHCDGPAIVPWLWTWLWRGTIVVFVLVCVGGSLEAVFVLGVYVSRKRGA